ncbi:hypothetical protein [Sorangium sp. So ce176]|uniref:hypothetical protein n=1 Tax=Sorangium sp. So ce176 TaxID=3133286 RepID=UPI003F62F08B
MQGFAEVEQSTRDPRGACPPQGGRISMELGASRRKLAIAHLALAMTGHDADLGRRNLGM